MAGPSERRTMRRKRSSVRIGACSVFFFVTVQAAVQAQPAAEATDATPVPNEQPAPPRAPSDPQQEEGLRRYRLAAERANNGDCAGAIAELEEVYELLSEHPRRHNVLFAMGDCYEQLLRFDAAIGAYQRYLDEAPADGDKRGASQSALRRLEALLGTLTIESNVPAAIWIDGREAGRAPGDVRVTSGNHTVELREPGYEAEVQEVTVASGRTETLSFELAALSDFDGISTAWPFAMGGAAIAAAIGGAVAGGIALSRGSVDGRPTTELDADRAATPALTADVLFGVAGALAITTIVLAVIADWDGDDDDAEAPSARLLLGPGRAILQGSF